MKVGFGSEVITPSGKIAIAGNIPPRVTDIVHDDVRAVAMVLEYEDIRTIWVSCDMCHIPKKLTDDVVSALKNNIADFKEEELIINATHATACACAGELAPRRIMYSAGGYNEKYEEGTLSAIRLGEFIAESIIKEKERPLKKYCAKELTHNRITKVLSFPIRMPTEKEAIDSVDYFANTDNFDQHGKPKGKVSYLKYVLIRKLLNEKPYVYNAKASVMKIADILFFTAPMEVYTEYSKRIAMKFPENPIFDVQLAFDYMGYLPTKEAIEHGGYSTEIFSTVTGADGGEMFIEEISKLLKEIKGDKYV